jgi:hypothetical protein
MFEWLTGKSKRAASETGGDDAVQAAPASADSPGDALARMHAARDSLWSEVGDVDPYVAAPMINPAFLGGPAWPGLRQAFVRVTRPDGVGIVTSSGLADPYDDGGPLVGLGCEVYLASPLFATTEVAGLSALWQFNTVYAIAQNVAGAGWQLGIQLERYGALSMEIPGADAPEGWLSDDGALGVLLGVSLPGVPSSISVPAGEVSIVGAVPLRADELAYVIAEGGAGRVRVADALRSLTAAQLSSPERTSVVQG